MQEPFRRSLLLKVTSAELCSESLMSLWWSVLSSLLLRVVDTYRLNKRMGKASDVVGMEGDSDGGDIEKDADEATEDLGQRLTPTS